MRTIPRQVYICVLAWSVAAACLAAICSIPTLRSRWQEQIPLERFKSGAVVLARDRVPALLISFVSVQFETEQPAPDIEASLSRRHDQPLSIKLARSAPLTYVATLAPPVLSLLAEPALLMVQSDSAAGVVTVGHTGAPPVRRALQRWWPPLSSIWLMGTLLLLLPVTWRHQQSLIASLRTMTTVPGTMLLIGGSAFVIRVILVMRGGQYFDLDEGRYTTAAGVFELLVDGQVNAAVEAVVRSPDHLGFRVISLLPALFHTASAWTHGVSITETRAPSGEWLPALILSLTSVGSIGLTYALATRVGANRREATLAALLMWASGSMLMYARHLMPYDVALTLLLLSLWIGLKRTGHPLRVYAAGAIAGTSFLTYSGYWLSVPAIGILLLIAHRPGWPGLVKTVAMFAGGFLSIQGIVVAAGLAHDVNVIAGFRGFAGTVTHGEFSEGWSLPWAALWHSDGALMIVCAIGIAWGIWSGRATSYWLFAAVLIYVGLVIGSNVLHRFVVYDRVSRQLVPFLCLAAASGLAACRSGRWLRGARGVALFGGVAVLGVLNAWPHLAQRFPREFARDAMRDYGDANLSIGTTLQEVDIVKASAFLPIHGGRAIYDPRSPTAYVLFDVTDLWVDRGIARLEVPPIGRILRREIHPRQRPIWQYHGYTPQQREFLRSVDVSMRLIEVERKP